MPEDIDFATPFSTEMNFVLSSKNLASQNLAPVFTPFWTTEPSRSLNRSSPSKIYVFMV
jgi:hypothetical protein